MMRRRTVAALCAVWTMAGCTSAETTSPMDGEGGAGGAAPEPLTFGACEPGYRTECTTMKVPLDHASPDGEAIDLHIARARASKEATSQLWLLSGGPGQGGYVFEKLVALLEDRLPSTDIYVVDHRGTGYSHRLTCPEQDRPDTNGGYWLDPKLASACLAHLDGTGDLARLPHFTTTQAARDVAAAIEATRSEEQAAYVWGGSYGTHWAHRILQVAPDVATGFIFDGYMTPEAYGFTDYDKGIQEVGERFANECAMDEDCAARMTDDPLAEVAQMYAQLNKTPCGQLDGAVARSVASYLLDSFDHRELLFPFLHRSRRCDPDDVTAVNFMLTKVTENASTDAPFLNSGVVQLNIALSELWHAPGTTAPTQSELLAAADEQLFLSGVSYPATVYEALDFWPLPPNDYADLSTPVNTDLPMLWLVGGLDTRTPPAQSAEVTDLYSGAAQHVVLLEPAGHTPSLRSPYAEDAARNCGLEIIIGFVAHGGEVDTSCESEMLPVTFSAANEETAEAWWGVPDVWGDAKSSTAHERSAARDPSFAPPWQAPMRVLNMRR